MILASLIEQAKRSDEEDLRTIAQIDACKARFAAIIHNLNRESPMKYALESLPELIGEHQFRDLCLSMGIATAVQLPSGPEFADIVSKRVLRTHREHEEHRRKQPEIL